MLTRIIAWGTRLLARVYRWVRAGGWKLLVVALGALLVVKAVHKVVQTHDQNIVLRERAQAAEESVAVLEQARAEDARSISNASAAKSRINHKERTGLARTQAALDQNPDWASQPIPSDILTSLRD